LIDESDKNQNIPIGLNIDKQETLNADKSGIYDNYLAKK
jgi:hypothetical protein